jgi:hypothetical protein
MLDLQRSAVVVEEGVDAKRRIADRDTGLE